MDDIFFECLWNIHHTNCESMFRPILTEEGLCYTFNMLNNSDLYADGL